MESLKVVERDIFVGSNRFLAESASLKQALYSKVVELKMTY